MGKGHKNTNLTPLSNVRILLENSQWEMGNGKPFLLLGMSGRLACRHHNTPGFGCRNM